MTSRACRHQPSISPFSVVSLEPFHMQSVKWRNLEVKLVAAGSEGYPLIHNWCSRILRTFSLKGGSQDNCESQLKMLINSQSMFRYPEHVLVLKQPENLNLCIYIVTRSETELRFCKIVANCD